ncbi:PIPO, partial [Celery mosaic virus]|uniref:PIPO n=1 Tax=Celery mosaic virus TaxID=112436 RepID=UPI000265501C
NLSKRIGRFMVRFRLVGKISCNALLASMAQVFFKSVQPNKVRRFGKQVQFLSEIITWKNQEMCAKSCCKCLQEVAYHKTHYTTKGVFKIPTFVCKHASQRLHFH